MAGGVPADIRPERIQALLTSRIVGRELRVLPEAGSTNDLAVAAGRAGAPEGACILADRQTGGRGRAGRRWSSPAGVGLYTSILLRPSVPPDRTPCLTLMAGLAVLDAIRRMTALQPVLKWPNDVLLTGRKTAGILSEMATEGPRVSQVVIGIGLNVNHGEEDFPDEVRPLGTSLRLAGAPRLERASVAAALYNALDDWYGVFLRDGAMSILRAARAATVTLGKRVIVLGGDSTWNGMAVDLDADGAILVQDEAGVMRRVLADDVSIREV